MNWDPRVAVVLDLDVVLRVAGDSVLRAEERLQLSCLPQSIGGVAHRGIDGGGIRDEAQALASHGVGSIFEQPLQTRRDGRSLDRRFGRGRTHFDGYIG